MRLRRLPSLLVVIGILGATAPRVRADEDEAAALAAARTLRSKLPAPAPKAAPFLFEGDLQVAGEKAGTVRWTAEPTKHAGSPAWLVKEEETGDFGGTATRQTSTLTLAKDLSLLQGTVELRRGDDRWSAEVKRSGAGFLVTCTVASGDDPSVATREVAAPAGTTYGRVALILFLRGLPPKPAARYALPWLDPLDSVLPKNEHTIEEGAGPLVLEPRGDGRFDQAGPPRDSTVVEGRRGQRAFDLHLTRTEHALIGIVGRTPRHHVVPAGTAAAAESIDDDAPARSWKAAFLKFGHGYHMGKKEWLDAAFHWPTWYEHSTKVAKDWPAERPLEDFRREWVQAFLDSSPHRTRAQADQLLMGTLETGRVTERADDRVVFAADAAYGGGVQRTYHLREIDRVWYVVRIDSAE